jgi:ankyrin repeat protein
MLQVVNDEGCTPLHRAAAAGHANVVKQLLQKNADTHATDSVSCISNSA